MRKLRTYLKKVIIMILLLSMVNINGVNVSATGAKTAE